MHQEQCLNVKIVTSMSWWWYNIETSLDRPQTDAAYILLRAACIKCIIFSHLTTKTQLSTDARQGPDLSGALLQNWSSWNKIIDGLCQPVCFSNWNLFLTFEFITELPSTHYWDKEAGVRGQNKQICVNKVV